MFKTKTKINYNKYRFNILCFLLHNCFSMCYVRLFNYRRRVYTRLLNDVLFKVDSQLRFSYVGLAQWLLPIVSKSHSHGRRETSGWGSNLGRSPTFSYLLIPWDLALLPVICNHYRQEGFGMKLKCHCLHFLHFLTDVYNFSF